MTADEVAMALVRSLFDFRRYIVVPNVTFGMLLPWEADLLACSSAGYLYEIEIKVTIADLKRDPLKRKWEWPYRDDRRAHKIKGMWYAMPEKVYAHEAAAACIPDHCGVIVLDPDSKRVGKGATIAKPMAQNPDVSKISDRQRLQLARLGVMRYWSRRLRPPVAAVAAEAQAWPPTTEAAAHG